MWLKLMGIIILVLALVACNTSGTTDDDQEMITPPIEEQDPDEMEEPNETEEPVNEEGNGTEEGTEDQEDSVTDNGSDEQTKPGSEFESELGYTIFVVDGYEFTAEEPRTDQVFLEDDGSNLLRIFTPGRETTSEVAEENLLEHAEGEIIEYPVEIDGIDYAYEEHFQSGQEEAYRYHIGKTFDDQTVTFTIILPVGEDMEEKKDDFFAMIDSISFD
ncbi:hypothetical protein [Alkalihalobacillus pseudalcaliphilus]|uniref:hypothetical protein n=1 Tax=Alkalihalobacillus pseudalcaliphilus TaxID=79884 RepID=UPI00064DD5ED|nr:hypothetical protein [Alkalihalobacillus pseudalcaliphilus]KMK76521.1 hypothetical protein AB990_15195 [Alkalihalobacillus pseudalcaliphilus]